MRQIRPATLSKKLWKNVVGYLQGLKTQIADIRAAGTYKNERIIMSPQGMEIKAEGKKVLNFCANNYLGFADNKRVSFESEAIP